MAGTVHLYPAIFLRDIVYLEYGFLLLVVDQMNVCVKCGGNIRVPKNLADGLDVRTGSKELARKCVPKCMKTKYSILRKSCRNGDLSE